MADKRMFSMKIVNSDAFLELPLPTQALYFHLSMRADDDGVVGNYKAIIRYIGASKKDLENLVSKRFVLIIDEVLVIKHWKINNYIQKDRYTPTSYQEEFKKVSIKENRAYTECIQSSTQSRIHDCIQNGSVEKSSKEKVSKEKTVSKDTVCQTDVRRCVDAWNDLQCLGIKPISKLSSGTRRHDYLVARIKQYGLDDVLKAIDKIKCSSFLQGRSDSKRQWTITFDWFVLPNNFPKVLDGNYDDHHEETSEFTHGGDDGWQ